ncbi:MAG: TetR/AcrR family transcriptional regulator [Saprospiraceae bacterium]|jgi:AcrR family transcriptional regulator|uniref:TetR/AcrR family transcriptional regulator n=1 Tax=Candidatus Brachybacter algidus TaxID=2982024 RepID=UPI001B55F41D|nr:TetR family transcriptional regulator [Candidatus Brachybacter algidus]MBP7306200.1 TetR/AcrR family transcriptional regulator [Saprospiraceae bacterium]MBK6375264.1 TetR/AcrR family transcriptional regulator [Candidatus Brachybacter algidus]MBK6449627.1 TetR/AcrR family transcriptional regulator [Candidatus Brachybacter algidus]MBK7604486.1 TetR/AcrR family transcriptional regulator [Candidatus Brachybacter algidus]MBK8603951.1 TetR/AcrR family transcriptional regulator [Candidatus Brachyb
MDKILIEKTRQSQEGKDNNTEARIKEAARIVFLNKGFAATRTRDIAEEADINLALLNYYFRSKQKLFNLIMLDALKIFLSSIYDVINDTQLTFEEKLVSISSSYIDTLLVNPEIPLFILSELRNDPAHLIENVGIRDLVLQSDLIKQLLEKVQSGEFKPVNPLNFIMNIIGMTVFPFLASPILKILGNMDQKEFNTLIESRKEQIPKWVLATLKA